MDLPHLGDAIPKRGNFITKFIGRSMLTILGWRIRADVPNLPKMVIIAAPHTSTWDFYAGMFAILALGIKISWMGKHTIFHWPVNGILTWLGGIPVNRSLPTGVVSQIVEQFREKDKFILGLMPEGTRSRVRKWRTGFYYIALQANVPVVLVRFDVKQKLISLLTSVQPTGDIESEMVQIRSSFTQNSSEI